MLHAKSDIGFPSPLAAQLAAALPAAWPGRPHEDICDLGGGPPTSQMSSSRLPGWAWPGLGSSARAHWISVDFNRFQEFG